MYKVYRIQESEPRYQLVAEFLYKLDAQLWADDRVNPHMVVNPRDFSRLEAISKSLA